MNNQSSTRRELFRHGILPNKPVVKRARRAGPASGNGYPRAFAFPAAHNLSQAMRTVSPVPVEPGLDASARLC
jgi:hypothetical protein